MVLGGSETYIPQLALDISLLLYFGTVFELLQLEGSRGRSYPWIWLGGKLDGSNELVKGSNMDHILTDWSCISLQV